MSALTDLNRNQRASETDTFTRHRYRQMSSFVSPGSRVLDVGCNTGRGGAIVRQHVPDVHLTGLELVRERVDRIPLGAFDRICVGTLETAPFEDGSFDAIMMGELLEHLPSATVEDCMRKVICLLAEGGKLILTTPNPHYFLLNWRSNGSVLGGPHVSVHCPRALPQFLRWLGFTRVQTFGSGRVSRLIGTRLPHFLYGSYLLVASR